MLDVVPNPCTEPETPKRQPEVVWRVRRNLMQEPGFVKGVCCYCGTNVFVTDLRMKVENDYCHHENAYDRREAQRCLVAYARKALVLAQNAMTSE